MGRGASAAPLDRARRIRETPLGADIWGDTALALPENLTLSKKVITGKGIGCRGRRLVGELLADFPVALFA